MIKQTHGKALKSPTNC